MPRFLSRPRNPISGFVVGVVHIWRFTSYGPQFGHPEFRPNPHQAHTKPTPNPQSSRQHAHNKPTPNPEPRRDPEPRGLKGHLSHTKRTPSAHQAHIRPITQKTAIAHTLTPNPQRSSRHVHTMVRTKPRPNPERVDSMRGTRRHTSAARGG